MNRLSVGRISLFAPIGIGKNYTASIFEPPKPGSDGRQSNERWGPDLNENLLGSGRMLSLPPYQGRGAPLMAQFTLVRGPDHTRCDMVGNG